MIKHKHPQRNVSYFSYETLHFASEALILAFKKLNPFILWRNPIIFVVFIGAILTSLEYIKALHPLTDALHQQFCFSISMWLWLTVFFATLAEAIAEGRGKAQAKYLRNIKGETFAKRLIDGKIELICATALCLGDIIIAEAGDTIASDGEVIEGIASIDESAITGESAPVIRESGGDRSSVTGGTQVLSDKIIIRITAIPGQTALDRMISLVEGSVRHKTPNETALTILLLAMTLIFMFVIITIPAFSKYAKAQTDIVMLIALLVTLIPTTIGGLLSAIGIAGMNRLLQINVLANSGRAVEAAGDVDVMLFDKTGTITLGNRQAVNFIPCNGITLLELVNAIAIASISDETPEGRSIVELAKTHYGWQLTENLESAEIIPFSASTRCSGIRLNKQEIRKGSNQSIINFIKEKNKDFITPQEFTDTVDTIARQGGTPLGVAINDRLMGVIHLKDIIKTGLKQRFQQLHRMGIQTVMVTGDNHLTAAAIAEEAGISSVISEATPEDKLDYIRKTQKMGHLVAMCGDGSNDAPALSQADVAVAMNTGTPAAKEAGNMIDLDSDPTKIIDIVSIGKQMLITRGALTTFSISNDVAKYFAIIPAMFSGIYPQLNYLNIMRLATPQSAILSAIIFNALILVALLPLALKGVKFRPTSASRLLRRNLLIYGLGGVIVPFIGIKIIDLLIEKLAHV